ncbi:MAG TPA: methyl-accepting chemotaxis protein [Armatimonadota bacterium]|nr:methyl-accepting chemotaxis protein [Armatimonadota bacterium]
MQWFYNLKIGTKLLLGFSLIVLVAILVGTVGILNLSKIQKLDKELYEVNTDPISHLTTVAVAFQRIRVNMRNCLLNYQDPAALGTYQQKIGTFTTQINDNMTEFEKVNHSDAILKEYTQFKDTQEQFLPIRDSVISLARAGNINQARQLMLTKADPIAREVEKHIDKLIEMKVERAGEKSAQNAATARSASRTMIIMLCFCAIVSIGLGLFISRAVTGPIHMLVRVAEQLSKGDVNIEATYTGKDEVGTLFRSMTMVVQTLQQVLAEVASLTREAVHGKLGTRAHAQQFHGGYRDLVQGINNTLDVLVGYLDSSPCPAFIIDTNYAIQYINDAAANLIGKNKQHLLETKCYEHFKTSDCKTANCACAIAQESGRQTEHETDAHPNGLDLEILYTALPVRDMDGRIVGAFEVIQDQTEIKKAIRAAEEQAEVVQKQAAVIQKQASYQEQEVKKLIINLGNVAKGNLHVDTTIAATDADTEAVGQNFTLINTSLQETIDAINLMVEDATMLAQAAVEGNLTARASASKHGGDFAKIIQGVNDSLDAVVTPLNEIATRLNSLAQNDLTARVTGDYRGDFARIRANFNGACDALEATIKEVSSVVAHVTESAEQMALVAENVGKASQEVASGSQQVAEGSGEQAQSANSVAQNVEQLQRAIEEVAKGAQMQAVGAEQAANAAQEAVTGVKNISSLAEKTAVQAQAAGEVAQHGAKIVQDTIEGMERVRQSTAESSEKVNTLGEASKKIGEIVEAINDIAEQTNLLALNAAIEAARAGEHGKGFAVVADEVRKLAERSAGQTKEIAALIRGIQEGIDAAVASMVAGTTEVENGMGLANNAGEALAEILTAAGKAAEEVMAVSRVAQDVEVSAAEVLKAVENVSSVTEETNAATEEMAASSSEVTRAIEHVAAVTEQSSSVAEELSAAAEEQNASVEEMTASSKELANLAAQAQEQLSKFTVSDMADDGKKKIAKPTSGFASIN